MSVTFAELDYDYAASLAARAIRAMAEQQIPATRSKRLEGWPKAIAGPSWFETRRRRRSSP
jgi:hypothetical protein